MSTNHSKMLNLAYPSLETADALVALFFILLTNSSRFRLDSALAADKLFDRIAAPVLPADGVCCPFIIDDEVKLSLTRPFTGC